MTMPKDLVLVRHGESMGNVATAMSKKGDGSLVRLMRHLHNWQYRLSPRGREQAAVAGAWLRGEFPAGFDAYYASPFVRPRETAGLLALPNANWRLELRLVEREWGQMSSMTPSERENRFASEMERRMRDGMLWAPPGGESILQTAQRVQRFVDTMAREFTGRSVVVVCHGDIMWAFRVVLERLTLERFTELDDSANLLNRINNCQILHYTRTDPESGQMADHLNWMRSVCPTDLTLSSNVWTPVVRPTFSNEQLLAGIAGYKTFHDDM